MLCFDQGIPSSELSYRMHLGPKDVIFAHSSYVQIFVQNCCTQSCKRSLFGKIKIKDIDQKSDLVHLPQKII